MYRVHINYRRILQKLSEDFAKPYFLPLGFRPGQCLRPTTSKDTATIARAHQHRNWERYTGRA